MKNIVMVLCTFLYITAYGESTISTSQIISNQHHSPADPYVYKGKVKRSALLSEKANYPYSRYQDVYEKIERVLIDAFVNGEITGHHPVTHAKLTPDALRDLLADAYGINQEASGYIGKNYLSQGIDMFAVIYNVEINNAGIYKEQPNIFLLEISKSRTVKSSNVSAISFDYNEAMKILKAKSGMWYAIGNNADSCSVAQALTENRVCWEETIVSDVNSTPFYTIKYDQDSLKYIRSYKTSDAKITALTNKTYDVVFRQMNGGYKGIDFPANPVLPIYLEYATTRYVYGEDEDAEENKSTYLNDLSAYIVNKALKGELTVYSAEYDSINVRVSVAEFTDWMTVEREVTSYETEEPQTSIESYTYKPSDYNVYKIVSKVIVTGKDSLKVNDKIIQLRLPSRLIYDYDKKGILANFSYDELVLLMSKEETGKALLMQLNATQYQPLVWEVTDIYGNKLYEKNYSKDTNQAQLKNIPLVLTSIIDISE